MHRFKSLVGAVLCWIPAALLLVATSCSSGERNFDGGQGARAGAGQSGAAGAGGSNAGNAGQGNGGEGNQTGGPVSLTEAALPDGWYNQDYSVELETSGGTEPLVFTISDGNLPNGLTLGENGTIAGRPSNQGVFNFTVLVTDAAGTTDSAAFTVRIARKRWLAVWILHGTSTHVHLLDVTNPLLTGIDLTPTAQASAYVNDVAFSPDGRWLAYRGTFTASGTSELQIVDLRAADPGAPIVLPGDGSISGFEWSPDSTKIAYVSDGDRGLRYTDVSAAAPTHHGPISPGKASSPPRWVNNTTIACGTLSGTSIFAGVARLDGASSPELAVIEGVSFAGIFQPSEPLSERFALSPAEYQPNSTYFDLATPKYLNANLRAWFSPSLEFAAYSTGTLVAVVPGDAFDAATPLVSFAGHSPVWSGGRLLWSTGENKLSLGIGHGQAMTAAAVPGDYTYPSNPRWSAPFDGYVFRAGEGLFFTQVNEAADQKVTPAAPLTPELPTTAGVWGHYMAPNGESVIYLADQEHAGKNEIWAATLGPTPGTPRRLNGSLLFDNGDVWSPPSRSLEVLQPWSSDSSLAAFAVDRFGDSSYSLYLVDMVDPSAQPTPVSWAVGLADAPRALFQP